MEKFMKATDYQNVPSYIKDSFLQRLNHTLFPHLGTSGTPGGYVPGSKTGKGDFYCCFLLLHSKREPQVQHIHPKLT